MHDLDGDNDFFIGDSKDCVHASHVSTRNSPGVDLRYVNGRIIPYGTYLNTNSLLDNVRTETLCGYKTELEYFKDFMEMYTWDYFDFDWSLFRCNIYNKFHYLIYILLG